MLSGCRPEVRLEVYDAIIEYAKSGTLTDLKPIAQTAFSFIKKKIDEDNMTAAELRRKRSEGGRKGMRNRYKTGNTVATQPNSVITQPNSVNSVRNKEKFPHTPSKEESSPKGEEKIINNNILLTRTREEEDLAKFDALLQEVVDGKWQIWVDQMRKKQRIDNVIDYLPSFRDHVIANATVRKVSDIYGFQQYFNIAFRYFSVLSPLELLSRYEEESSSEPFRKYCEWICKSAPNVAREIAPLTEQEFTKLREVYSGEKIADTILAISNRKDLVQKYYSLYLTLLSWLEKDYSS